MRLRRNFASKDFPSYHVTRVVSLYGAGLASRLLRYLLYMV